MPWTVQGAGGKPLDLSETRNLSTEVGRFWFRFSLSFWVLDRWWPVNSWQRVWRAVPRLFVAKPQTHKSGGISYLYGPSPLRCPVTCEGREVTGGGISLVKTLLRQTGDEVSRWWRENGTGDNSEGRNWCNGPVGRSATILSYWFQEGPDTESSFLPEVSVLCLLIYSGSVPLTPVRRFLSLTMLPWSEVGLFENKIFRGGGYMGGCKVWRKGLDLRKVEVGKGLQLAAHNLGRRLYGVYVFVIITTKMDATLMLGCKWVSCWNPFPCPIAPRWVFYASSPYAVTHFKVIFKKKNVDCTGGGAVFVSVLQFSHVRLQWNLDSIKLCIRDCVGSDLAAAWVPISGRIAHWEPLPRTLLQPCTTCIRSHSAACS